MVDKLLDTTRRWPSTEYKYLLVALASLRGVPCAATPSDHRWSPRHPRLGRVRSTTRRVLLSPILPHRRTAVDASFIMTSIARD